MSGRYILRVAACETDSSTDGFRVQKSVGNLAQALNW